MIRFRTAALLGLPVSTSQAVVGAILGLSVLNNQLNFPDLGKVLLCWFGTPVGGALVAVLLYRVMAGGYNRLPLDPFSVVLVSI